jgi:hypothetical protein
MENRAHTDLPPARRLPFNDPFGHRRHDDETDNEVSRMENEGGPPPIVRKDVRDDAYSAAVPSQRRSPLPSIARGPQRPRT